MNEKRKERVRARWDDEPPPFVSGGKLNEVSEEQALREAEELDAEMEEYRRQGEADRNGDDEGETNDRGGDDEGESNDPRGGEGAAAGGEGAAAGGGGP